MKSKSLLRMSASEAKSFFLKSESYCNFDLPDYFTFDKLLKDTDSFIGTKKISDFYIKKSEPKEFENVNYIILNNKDGKYSWRRMELIHPALYIALVNLITTEENWKSIRSKLKSFGNSKINCLSIPVSSTSTKPDQAEQILNWWIGVEQESIKLSTEFDHLIQIDLTDCYGAIYTHSIAWALHTKKLAKENKGRNSMLGDEIDVLIRHMRNGQTNGIPQGSVLMDFVAEILLSYLDNEIIQKIDGTKYKIIRYRDDYRIFINDLSFGKEIVKAISECASNLGLKLNSSKTHISKNIVTDAIKKDKLDWLMGAKYDTNPQKHLLLIHQHSLMHPNSGSTIHALNDFYKSIITKDKIDGAETQIAIAVDIAFNSPKTYPIFSAIISKLLSTLRNNQAKEKIIKKIQKKFSKIPNTGHMDLWLQRVTYPLNPNLNYNEELCKLVNLKSASVWNNEWISSPELKKTIDPKKIIDKSKLKSIAPIIESKEVDLFANLSNHYP